MRSWHLPGPALISASPRELKALRPSEKPHPPPWQGPPTVSDSVGMGYCFHLCPQAILRAHQPGTICVPIPETLTWGACSVAQARTVPHLAHSDLVLREEVRVVESCQVLQEPRLGIPRPWESMWVWTPRLGSWRFSTCPSRATWEFLHSLLCFWRLTSMNSGCLVQPMRGPCQGSLKTGG